MTAAGTACLTRIVPDLPFLPSSQPTVATVTMDGLVVQHVRPCPSSPALPSSLPRYSSLRLSSSLLRSTLARVVNNRQLMHSLLSPVVALSVCSVVSHRLGNPHSRVPFDDRVKIPSTGLASSFWTSIRPSSYQGDWSAIAHNKQPARFNGHNHLS